MTTNNPHPVDDLSKRVQELTLLHDVARILWREDLLSVGDWLEEIARAIQRAWPHPGAVAVRAELGAFQVATFAHEDDLPVICRAEFTVADGRVGAIEVVSGQVGSSTGAAPASNALLEDIAEMFRTAVDRRLVMTALRQSEQRYRSVVEQQSDLVCRYLPDTTLTFVNDAYCRFVGQPREAIIGHRFIDLIPGEERAAALAHIESLLHGGNPRIYEHNVLLPDGSVGRQQWVDHAITSPDGGVEELQGIGRDITDRWRSEEALHQNEVRLREAYQRIRSLAHRLMLAQEAERTEIARDLHDDVGQQLAALEIGLSLVETRADDNGGIRDEVARLRQMASALAEKVRHVSHSLHPGVLQHAGLSAAIASHCETVANQHSFLVTFETRGTFTDVPDDVALCLYRAAQQALRNVAMHADARRVWVLLARTGHQVELTITDDGRGFEPSAVRARGLGLLSIEERVHVAHGKFSVTSSPGGGSTLAITVPVG
jgi:PAS domain S-box-containing protein